MSKKGWVVIGVAALIVIGVVANHGGSDDSSSDAASAVVPDALEGKISGHFARDCFLCGSDSMDSYISVSDVWCAWRDDSVIVHVTMTNDSVEHVTVNWHPSYTIVGGGEHGTGLSSAQSDGFDSGETRELEAEQQPEGVPPDSELGSCKPSFQMVESG